MWSSALYHALFRRLPKPFAFVDLDAWQANMAALRARSGQKHIRAATQSIRCLNLRDKWKIGRWMCFNAEEALFLAQNGFNDLPAAYPTLQKNSIAAVCRAKAAGKKITPMPDHPAHIAALHAVAQSENTALRVAVDIDVSARFPGHFGTHRPSVKTAADFRRVSDLLDDAPFLRFVGVAGAHSRKNAVSNAVGHCLKNRSLPQIPRPPRRNRRYSAPTADWDRIFQCWRHGQSGRSGCRCTRYRSHLRPGTVPAGTV